MGGISDLIFTGIFVTNVGLSSGNTNISMAQLLALVIAVSFWFVAVYLMSWVRDNLSI